MNARPEQLPGLEHELAGNPAFLQECLGSPDGLTTLGATLWSHAPQPITNAASLRTFVEHYRDTILLPLELPAIQTAYLHAARYEIRELMAQDRSLDHIPALNPLAFASQAVGRAYLRRLRPLRDVRLLRRYEQAIQQGQAHGWHTLVYGAALTIYSLPLRQGLLSYARQTLKGFLHTGAGRLQLRVYDLRRLQDAVLTPLPLSVRQVCDASLRCLPPPSHGAPQQR